jgi:hypothetical protein
MTQYRINENLIKKSTRKLFMAYAPSGIILSVLIVVPLMVILNDGRMGTWAIAVALFLLFFGFQMVRTIRSQQALMKSYTLEVTDAGISQLVKDNFYIPISRMEIKEIIRLKNGGFLVTGPDGKQITIPHLLDNTGNLEQQLRALSHITTGKKDPFNLRYRWIMLLLTAVIYLCIIVSNNKIVIAVSSMLALGEIGFVAYQIWKIRNLRYASKRGHWFHILFLGIGLYFALIKLVPDSAFTPEKSHRTANNPSSNPPPIPAAGPASSA